MLAAAIPVASLAERHVTRRHAARRGYGQVLRRDPRRFGQAMVRVEALAAPATAQGNASMRLFAHTFGAAFLFVTVFLA